MRFVKIVERKMNWQKKFRYIFLKMVAITTDKYKKVCYNTYKATKVASD